MIDMPHYRDDRRTRLCFVFCCRRFGIRQEIADVPIPAVSAFVFDDAIVRGCSSSVLLADGFVLEGIHGIGGDRGHFVAGHLMAQRVLPSCF